MNHPPHFIIKQLGTNLLGIGRAILFCLWFPSVDQLANVLGMFGQSLRKVMSFRARLQHVVKIAVLGRRCDSFEAWR
jgi:hypothetical protein